MKKTLLLVLLALQSTAAFASTQVLNCRGVEGDEVGEVKKGISVEIKIINPSVNSLLVINGDAAGDRASLKIAGLPAIQVNGINVTNLRKAISISGYIKNAMMISAYVPVPALGKEGAVSVDMSRTTANNESFYTTLSCQSTIQNGF